MTERAQVPQAKVRVFKRENGSATMRLQRHNDPKLTALIAAIGMVASGCREKVLDLGPRLEPPRYATPGTVDQEDDAGLAMPTAVAEHQYGVAELVVDDTRIYWTANGSGWQPEANVLRSCAKADCAGTLVSYAQLPWGDCKIAVNHARIYWTAASEEFVGKISACPLAGCSGPPTTIATGIEGVALVADDEFVYWRSRDSTLLKCEVDGCRQSPALVTLAPDGQDGPGVLAVDATHLYWAADDGSGAQSGKIMTIPKDGSVPARVLVRGLHQPQSIVVDNRNVYWTEAYSLGAVKSCPLAGCAGEPAVLASRQAFPAMLAVFGDHAYWFTSNSDHFWQRVPPVLGHLTACPISGCGSTPTVLAGNQPRPRAIGVDGTHVYWTLDGESISLGEYGQYHDGTIKRLRRK